MVTCGPRCLRHMRRLSSCDRAAHAVYGEHGTEVKRRKATTPLGTAVDDRRLHHLEMAMAEIEVHPSSHARAAFTEDAALQELSVSAIVHPHRTAEARRTAAFDPATTLQRDVGVAVGMNSTTSCIAADGLAIRDRPPHQHGPCARPYGEPACARKPVACGVRCLSCGRSLGALAMWAQACEVGTTAVRLEGGQGQERLCRTWRARRLLSNRRTPPSPAGWPDP